MKKMFLLLWGAALLLAGCQSAPENVPAIELTSESAVRIVIPAEHANPGIDKFLKDGAAVIQKGLSETLGITANVEVKIFGLQLQNANLAVSVLVLLFIVGYLFFCKADKLNKARNA